MHLMPYGIIIEFNLLGQVYLSRQWIPIALEVVEDLHFPDLINHRRGLVSFVHLNLVLELSFEEGRLLLWTALRLALSNVFDIALLDELPDLLAPQLNRSLVLEEQVQCPVFPDD